MDPSIRCRDLAELERSASESRRIVLEPVDVDRYLNPLLDTPFPLEYAFHLVGDLTTKSVLDLGCGSGETLIPLAKRSPLVVGIDISPDLIELARQRIRSYGVDADARVGSAYETGLEDNSIDVVFCMSLIHHLDIGMVKREMLRILKPGGYIILKEPVSFSKTYSILRSLLPSHVDISEFEHPLTRAELGILQEGFRISSVRYFRLPFVPLTMRFAPFLGRRAWYASRFMIETLPFLEQYATSVAMRLEKPPQYQCHCTPHLNVKT